MDAKTILGYVFLALSAVVFVFLVLKDVYVAFLLKWKGQRAFGKVIGVKQLPGKDRYGQHSNGLVIEVHTDQSTFTFDCLNSAINNYPFGKVPVVFLPQKNGKRICNIDSWRIMLTDAILFFAISVALTIPYFIVRV